jgi:hypothetical protein
MAPLAKIVAFGLFLAMGFAAVHRGRGQGEEARK